MAKNFDEEVLEWALDQDSVQNLLLKAERDWELSRKSAYDRIMKLAHLGLVSFYEDAPERGNFVEIHLQDVSLSYIDARHYTWLSKTERTIPYLNELRTS